MDFSYPICFETEKFWKPSAEGCLVYSFGVDDNWKFAEGMKDHSQGSKKTDMHENFVFFEKNFKKRLRTF